MIIYLFILMWLIGSILGNGDKCFDCSSDKQQEVKHLRIIMSVEFWGLNMVSEEG